MECHNKVFDSKRCALSAQAVYFLHSTCSVTCLRLSDVSVICRVTYFQFQIQVCISPMSVRQAAERLIGLRNIGYRTLPKIWVGTFLYAAYSPEEWFWIDYSGKIETRHPIEGYFCVFFWKNDPLRKIFKILFESFNRLTIDVFMFKFREMLPTGNREIVRYLPDKKIACLSNSRYCVDRAQNLPGPTHNNVLRVLQIPPNRFTFCGVIAECV